MEDDSSVNGHSTHAGGNENGNSENFSSKKAANQQESNEIQQNGKHNDNNENNVKSENGNTSNNDQNGHSTNNNNNGVQQQQQDQNAVDVDEDTTFVAPELPDSPEKEKEIIKELELANRTLTKNATWYLLSIRWWKMWKQYVRYDIYQMVDDATRPVAIDNSPIIENEDGALVVGKNALENLDYTVVHSRVWKTLRKWYGGGPSIPRKVIGTGWNDGTMTVEIRPLMLKVYKSSDMTSVHLIISKSSTINQLKKLGCEKLNLNVDNVRVWDYHNDSRYKLLNDGYLKLDSCQILDRQSILLEEKDPQTGRFNEERKGYSSSYHSSQPSQPGICGLVNLGNTCFMNSSLQCLSNTKPLCSFFVENPNWTKDINATNPLGSHGELAEEFADLLKTMWNGENSVIAPRDFKFKLERFAPQFAGYQQHDSQELLAFLLDGLHEDLNRVIKKPYKELKDAEGRSEEDVAGEMWDYHRARNNSIIVDYFQGQLKSTLVCPDCAKVSVTFDPFMYLSLPLPVKNTRLIKVTFVWLDPTKKNTRVAAEVIKNGCIKDLKVSLSELTGVAVDRMEVTEVFTAKFFRHYKKDDQDLEAIQERDEIYAYETLAATETQAVTRLPVLFVKEDTSYSSYSRYPSPYSIPLILSFPTTKVTYGDLYDAVYRKIAKTYGLPTDKILQNLQEFHDIQQAKQKEKEEKEKLEKEKEEKEKNETTTQTSNPSTQQVEQPDEPMTDTTEQQKDSDSSSDDEQTKKEEEEKKQEKSLKDTPLLLLLPYDGHVNPQKNVRWQQEREAVLDLSSPDYDPLHAAVFLHQDVMKMYTESIDKEFEPHSSVNKLDPDKANQESGVSLDSCLELFTTQEKLGPEDPWYCSNCKKHQQATKKFDLWRLPQVLFVHLKRFSYRNGRSYREKLETFIDYPIEGLDLSKYLKGKTDVPPIYDLYAASLHYGGLGGGHYTASCKNWKTGKWFRFDDSSVSSEPEGSKLQTAAAYLLFYQLRQPNTNGTTTTTTTSTTSTTNDVPMKEEVGNVDQPMKDA